MSQRFVVMVDGASIDFSSCELPPTHMSLKGRRSGEGRTSARFGVCRGDVRSRSLRSSARVKRQYRIWA